MQYLITNKNLPPVLPNKPKGRQPAGLQDAHRQLLHVITQGVLDRKDDKAMCVALAESVASQVLHRTYNGQRHTTKQVWDALNQIIAEHGVMVETVHKDGKTFVGNPDTAWLLQIRPLVQNHLRGVK